MWGYYFLGKIILYVIVLIAVGILIRIAFKSGKAALVAVVITATIPWWDLYPRWFKHQELCELDGGYRVYRTVPEGVHGYFDSDKMGSSKSSYRWSLEHYKYDYIEGYRNGIDLQIYRISLQDNELIYQPIDSVSSRYEYFQSGYYKKGKHPYGILSDRNGIRDRYTGEVMASLTYYWIKNGWGWYFSFPDSGRGCKGHHEAIIKRAYFTNVIPSVNYLKENSDG